MSADRRVYIGLLIAAVAFFFIGNLGGNGGNPSWLLAPVCLAAMIVLGLVALVRSVRGRSRAR